MVDTLLAITAGYADAQNRNNFGVRKGFFTYLNSGLAEMSVTVATGALPEYTPSARRAPATTKQSLKICFICEAFAAGVGRAVVSTVVQLASLGHELTVIYSPVRQNPDYLATMQRTSGVRLFAVKMSRSVGPSDLIALLQIVHIVGEAGPFDIIHGHSAKGGGYARLLALFKRCPVIYSPHAFITLSPRISRRKWVIYAALEWLLASLTARVICCSSDEARHARLLGIGTRRLALVPNGMSANTAPTGSELRAQHGFAPDDIIVGFVGRMEDQKAPELFVEAAVKLLPKVSNLKFVMVGEGPKRQPLEALLQHIPHGERVVWLGDVEARPLMGMFDIFALTSLYEGFPFVLIEALSAGLPIISTPVGGTEEVIKLGMNGLLVPHGSARRLAEAIEALALDPDSRRRMGEASRQKATEFTIVQSCDILEQVYYEVLDGRSTLKLSGRLG